MASQVLQSLSQSFGDCTELNNYNWYRHHFHVQQLFQGLSNYLSFHFPSVLSCGQPERQLLLFFFFFFLLIITSSSRLTEIRWCVCISKSQRVLCTSFQGGFWVVHLLCVCIVNVNFLHNSQSITSPTQSGLVLNCLRANLLYLLIMWLIVSSLPLHNLHLLFYCDLFILALS